MTGSTKLKALTCAAGYARELVVVYTIWKPMLSSGFDELKQFVLLTSGTSSGSANVISAHCVHFISHRLKNTWKPNTYIVERGAVLRRLNDLDGCIVAD